MVPSTETGALADTWAINNRIGVYLLAGVPPAALGDTAGGKGRTVAGQFAHLHNVRLMWLKAAMPELLGTLAKVETDGQPAAPELRKHLETSGRAIETLIAHAVAAGGKLKGFKPHVTAFVGYLIAHEAHHRGQIMLSLKQSGHPVDKKVAYGLWEWGTR